jgi:pyruvate formate lyase activating enzyme
LGCGECAKQCPAGAKQLIGEYKTVPEVIQLIMRDRPFYMNSGGGVTLSGGEILQQPAFAYEILKESRVLGIQTAIETSGYGQWEWLDRISDVCSTIHYDIKALDVNQHRDLTSRSNKLILENLQALDFKLAQLQVEKRPKLILRIPLIENLNDSEEEVVRLGMYIKHNLTSYDRIELLPFHNFGESKYQKLDLNYEFIGVSNAAKLKYEPLAARLLELDLSAAVMTW